MKLEKEAESLK